MKMFEQRGHDSNKGDVFGYDDVYRLTNVKFNSPDPQNQDTTQFDKSWNSQYDKVDNIISLVETQNQVTNEITPTMTDTNAQLNQYTTFDQLNLSYDLNGNTTQKGAQQFYYDYRNQVVRAAEGGVTTAEYEYDAFGRRISKQLPDSPTPPLTYYYYSGNQVIEERDGADNILKQYIYGNGIDELLSIVNYTGATQTPYYVHTNAIGSITSVTDENGNLVERISYDTFGMPTFTDATNQPLSASSIGNDILFHGRRYDEETNLYYYRARYYDPIMGRFLQTDPMGYADSMNMYQAFNHNPLNFLDPMGERIYLTGEKPKEDFERFLRIFKSIGHKNIQEYLTLEMNEDGKYYVGLKGGKGTLSRLGSEILYPDKDKIYLEHQGRGFDLWLKNMTKSLQNLRSPINDQLFVYDHKLEELFEFLILDRKHTPIEFRTGNKFKKYGRANYVNRFKYGGGVTVEPFETESGNIEIVVNPDSYERNLYNAIPNGGTLHLNLDIIVVHEFGHAFASMLGYVGEKFRDPLHLFKRSDPEFWELSLLFENLYRLRRGKKWLRTSHDSDDLNAVSRDNFWNRKNKYSDWIKIER